MFSSRALLAGLIGAVGASGGLLSVPAYAQSPPPATAGGMTVTSSNVDQFLLTPEGTVDGLLLQNNTIVRFSANMRREISQRVRPGDLVVVSGAPEGAGQLHASKLEDRTAQITISENPPSGPPSASGERQAMTVSGTVRVVTRSPRGDVDGAVLSNGVVIHVAPDAALYFSNILRPDQPLAASGWGTVNQFGKSVEASSLGPSIDKLTPVQIPPQWIPPSNPPSTR